MVEAMEAAQCLTKHRIPRPPPKERIIQPKILRRAAAKKPCCDQEARTWGFYYKMKQEDNLQFLLESQTLRIT